MYGELTSTMNICAFEFYCIKNNAINKPALSNIGIRIVFKCPKIICRSFEKLQRGQTFTQSTAVCKTLNKSELLRFPGENPSGVVVKRDFRWVKGSLCDVRLLFRVEVVGSRGGQGDRGDKGTWSHGNAAKSDTSDQRGGRMERVPRVSAVKNTGTVHLAKRPVPHNGPTFL